MSTEAFTSSGHVIGRIESMQVATSRAGKDYGKVRMYGDDEKHLEILCFGKAFEQCQELTEGDYVVVSIQLGGGSREHNGNIYYDTTVFGSKVLKMSATQTRAVETQTDDDDLPF